jgi:hypothetical protein
MRRLPFFFRDAAARSSWGDVKVLLLFAIEQNNRSLLESFR